MNKEIEEILKLTIQFVEDELDKGTPKKDIIKAYSTQVGEAFNHIKGYITNLQEELKSIKENYKIQLEYDKDLEKRFNSLLEAHKICDEEEQEKQERIDKATGIANERINYCYQKNDKEQLESWEEIFDILQGSDKE